MKLILGDLEVRHSARLIKELPQGVPLIVTNMQKIKNISTEDDVVLFYNYKYRKQYPLIKCKEIFPNTEASTFCENRIRQCKILDVFPGNLQRTYLENHCGLIKFEKGFVYKFGNAQQGLDKYLGGVDIGFLTYNDNIIKEEYIKGRSIRLLVINNDLFVIEQINHKNWLANVNPDDEIVETFNIENVLHTKLHHIAKPLLNYFNMHNMKSITWGFDFIVSEFDEVGLLEINDMCGIPHDERCDNSFINNILNTYSEYK